MPPSRKRHGRPGFTLIELLTVIAIIAILMALLLPALVGAKNAAHKAQARNDLVQLVAAVKNFDTDFGVYPLDPNLAKGQGAGQDQEYGAPGSADHNSVVIDILIGDGNEGDANQGNAINYKGQSYLDVPLVKDPTNPKSGLIATTGNIGGAAYIRHDWVDPWGGTYVIDIDANYDNYVSGTQLTLMQYHDINYDTPPSLNSPAVQTGCVAGALGADHQIGTKGDGNYKTSDDVLSWQ